MPPDSLEPVREALKAGNKKTAQAILRPMLNDQPTAEMWRLAAQACPNVEKTIVCLRRAVALDPDHDGANRLLRKLESAQAAKHASASPASENLPSEAALAAAATVPTAVVSAPPVELLDDQPSLDMLAVAPEAASLPLEVEDYESFKPGKRHRKKTSTTRRIVILSVLLIAASVTLFTLNMVGIISGPVTAITVLTGGATPVHEIDGVPLHLVEDAPLKVEPAQTELLEARDADVLEPGYEHEYTFTGRADREMAIYVQFLSLAANRVSRNVVLLRPDNSDATSLCQRDSILQGDNNIALICSLDATGEWKVRILGREGESVGAYFVGVEAMS